LNNAQYKYLRIVKLSTTFTRSQSFLSSESNSSPFALKLLPVTATKSEDYLRKGFEVSRKDESPRVNF